MNRVYEAAPGLGWYEEKGDVGAFALGFPAGFRAEGAGRPGLAHFTEHLLMAPRDESAHPYAQLEERGFLLEAQTRRDHLTVSLSGPQKHLLGAVDILVTHLVDRRRPGGAARQQAEIIHNEVLEKTGLDPASDRWRWCVAVPGGAIGADHDPVVAPALAGLAVYADVWQGFAADHVRLEQCAAAVAADPALVRPEDVQSLLGPRPLPPTRPAVAPASFATAAGDGRPAPRKEVVLPVLDGGLPGQSAALVAARLIGEALAAATGYPSVNAHYGLFDEWFSEDAPTVLTVPMPPGSDSDALEQSVGNALRSATEPHTLARACEQLSDEWKRRIGTPSAGSRLTAWMLLGARMGVPFTDVDAALVTRSLETAVLPGGPR
ncbi:insulinase family protein [Streptomyces sp. 130]|uniref:insulinase family protein n=1 Tax=Streptomyces sp. 130 TaxID=2591006 RepID=UPI00117EAA9E|nr:insulinase family protein [Streptomyces sp. 130]TRV80946.1 insulinase family protein [Streptomyces sp. 130]